MDAITLLILVIKLVGITYSWKTSRVLLHFPRAAEEITATYSSELRFRGSRNEKYNFVILHFVCFLHACVCVLVFRETHNPLIINICGGGRLLIMPLEL